jgi:hypothetical protein
MTSGFHMAEKLISFDEAIAGRGYLSAILLARLS